MNQKMGRMLARAADAAKSKLRHATLGAAMLLAGQIAATTSHAQQMLDDIIAKGKVVVGIDLSAPPMGFMTADQKEDGLDVDIARLIADGLKVELEIVPTTAQNRVPYLLTKRVDLVIASFAPSPERAKSVAFSIPYMASRTLVVAAKTTEIKGTPDLSGKKIAVARGSQNEITLTQTAPKDAEIIKMADDASAMAALTSGQVDAFASSEGLARPILERFGDKYEAKYSLSSGFLSIGVRRGDPDMIQWLNTTIAWNRHKGFLDPIIQKWMGFVLPTPTF